MTSMKRLFTICIAAMVCTLAACTEEAKVPTTYAQPIQQQASVPEQNQPQVVYQQSPQQEDHTIRDGLIGAGVGYMLGRHTAGAGITGGSGSSYHPPQHNTVVNRTAVNKTVVVQQRNVYRPPPVRTSPRYIAPRPTVSRSFASPSRRR